MTQHISRRHVAFCLGWLLAMAAGPAVAQDAGLSRAKTFYASASYEEALATLSSLRGKVPAPESTEAGFYEVLCLVALGRNDEAKQTIEAIVRADPEYHLTDEASPRVRTMFDTVRRPMLSGVIREAYTRGRDAFDRKDMPVALKEFDRVIAIGDELGAAADQGLRDLRTLASGFRDLTKMALAAAPPPAPAPATPAEPVAPPSASPAPPPALPASSPASAAPASAAPAPPSAYGPGDENVRPPVAISQSFPPWRPASTVEAKRDFRGALDLLIDEQGRVVSATMLRSVHERYDPLLLDAARKWTYKPATKDGKPVRYRHTVMVNLVAK